MKSGIETSSGELVEIPLWGRSARALARLGAAINIFQSRRDNLILAAAILFAAGLKLILIFSTFGTNDVLFKEAYAAKIRDAGGIALYREGADLLENGRPYHREHMFLPPFMVTWLASVDALARATGVPIGIWVRVFDLIADSLTTLLVTALILPLFAGRIALWAGVALALAPTSLLISGFHGNIEPMVICFVIIAIYAYERWGAAMLSGAALGMALNMKIWPVVFTATFLLWARTKAERLRFAAAAAAVVFAGSLPYVLQDPVTIAKRVLGYKSFYGNWGISRILLSLEVTDPVGRAANATYLNSGPYIALLAAVALSFVLSSRRPRPSLFVACGAIALAFLCLLPAFGVQYLIWITPWVVVVRPALRAFFFAASGAFLCAVYTYWAGGFPWFLANSVKVGMWKGPIVWLEVLCWLSVVAVAVAVVRRPASVGENALTCTPVLGS